MARHVHGVLSASTVATVTITGPCEYIEVINKGGSGTDHIYVNSGEADAAPTVEGDFDCVVSPPSGCDRLYLPAGAIDQNKDGSYVIKLISAGTPKYSVSAVTTLEHRG